ncbi:MAG: hypothetical protein ACRD1M_06835 [Terriglobales bacterium]
MVKKGKRGKQVWIPATAAQFRTMERAAAANFQRLGAWMLEQSLRAASADSTSNAAPAA